MRQCSGLGAVVVVMLCAQAFGAEVFSEGFESGVLPDGYFFDAGGWDVPASGGNPDGFLRGQDTSIAPFVLLELSGPEASGDFAAAELDSAGVDVLVPTDDPGQMGVSIEFYSSGANLSARKFMLFDAPLGWTSFDFAFDPLWTTAQAVSNGWQVQVPASPGAVLEASEFSDLMQDVTFVWIQVGSSLADSRTIEFGLDNVRLVPAPATVVCLAPLIAMSGRRRAQR